MTHSLKLVRKYVVRFLNKSFCSLGSNTVLLAGDYVECIFKAAQANTYVETVCKNADSLHRRIKHGYGEVVDETYSCIVRKLVRKLNVRLATVAIDITSEPFYGKTRNFFIHNVKGDKGYGGEFKFAVISLVHKESKQKIPLKALPLHIGQGKADGDVIDELVSYAKSLFGVRLVLLDRGFYSADILDSLNRRNVKYIMFIPVRGEKIKGWIKETKHMSKHEHVLTLRKDKSTFEVQTSIVVCKEGEIDWCFATNVKLDDTGYIILYKYRWQIETNFRVEDEARIKSKSVSYLIRYFYFMISLLLHALWLVFLRDKLPFKAFLIEFHLVTFCNTLGIDYALNPF